MAAPVTDALYTMTENNIIQRLNAEANSILEKDIDEWIVPQLCDYYAIKIKSSASYAYGSTINRNGDGMHVALQAFRERARAEIRNAVNTFFFVSQHWRTGRDINTYLLTCLSRLASGIHNDVDGQRRISVPICPACREYGEKEYLQADGKAFRCSICFSKIENLEDGSEKAFRKIFATHSRAGFRCPDCEKFIPKSFDGSSCPYNDCSWFGNIDFLEKMSHPTGLGQENILSLNLPTGGNAYAEDNKPQLQDLIDGKNLSAHSNYELAEQYEIELTTLKSVINDQILSIKRNNNPDKLVQKLLMYQAYSNLAESQPEDMVSYLVHMKHSGVSSPVQSRIFQEYVKLVEGALPFSIFRGGKYIDIYSLSDPNLNLFLGVSEFEATVTSEGKIPNNTTETYVGGRQLKHFGPCFIGMLIDVVDRNTGENLTSHVASYTFSYIQMRDDVLTGTAVNVSHFRINSHYEIGSMVFLQRARRKIVDSVYLRLNKQKREITK